MPGSGPIGVVCAEVAIRRRIIGALCLAAGVAGLVFAGSAVAAHSRPGAHAAIVGGTSAVPGEFPWLAYVYSTTHLCTGTVVAPNVVLTAGHCAEDTTTGVLDPASSFDVATGNVDRTAAALQVSAVTQVLVYPGFNPATFYGDAALLVLGTPTSAPAIPLATASDLSLIQPGNSIEIAGWGYTAGGQQTEPAVLQWGSVVTLDPSYCGSKLLFDATSEFCVIDPVRSAVGTCNGDSGGPAIAEPTPTSAVEVGIASRAGPNCNTSFPGIFTRVDLVSAWVNQTIAAVVPPPTPAPVTPPAPAPAVSAPSTPAAPQPGKYTGRSSQHAGHVDVTLVPGGLTRLNLEFNLHCPRGRRGPLTTTPTWGSSPLALADTSTAWAFSTSFIGAHGWLYTVAGSFASLGAATGTLMVTTRNGQCTTGVVTWSAARASSPS